MDSAGCVDLQHDPYCLRIHFTTRWGVLEDRKLGVPQGGSIIDWDDRQWSLAAEGEHASLWADLKQAQ